MQAETRPQMTMIRVMVLRPDLFEKQVARHLKQEITDEEDARAQSVDRIAEAKVGLHLELRETNVDPVQVRKDVANEQERDQSPCDFGINVRRPCSCFRNSGKTSGK